MAEDTTGAQGGQGDQSGTGGQPLPAFDPAAAEAFFKDLIGRYNTDDNQIIMDLVSFHPLTQFDEKEFVDLLEHSLSLSVAEKKRVVDAIPTLSQYQIDELKKVFSCQKKEKLSKSSSWIKKQNGLSSNKSTSTNSKIVRKPTKMLEKSMISRSLSVSMKRKGNN